MTFDAVAHVIDPAALGRFSDRLDAASAAIEAYASPGLVLDVLLLTWPGRGVPARDRHGGVTGQRSRVRATVHGAVQGVGYRVFVQGVARGLALDGWVANRADGSVDVEAEGPSEALERLVDRLREGPSAASVREVEVHVEPARGLPAGFSDPQWRPPRRLTRRCTVRACAAGPSVDAADHGRAATLARAGAALPRRVRRGARPPGGRERRGLLRGRPAHRAPGPGRQRPVRRRRGRWRASSRARPSSPGSARATSSASSRSSTRSRAPPASFAEEPTTCLTLASWDLLAMLERDPRLALNMLRELVGRVRRADAQLRH